MGVYFRGVIFRGGSFPGPLIFDLKEILWLAEKYAINDILEIKYHVSLHPYLIYLFRIKIDSEINFWYYSNLALCSFFENYVMWSESKNSWASNGAFCQGGIFLF